jgi:hypothetical protein
MSIEDSLASHYRNVEIDDGAHQRLQSVITDLVGEPEHRAPRRLAASGVTALVVASCIAGAVWASRPPHPHHGAAGGLTTPGPVSVTNTGPGLPERSGYIGVTNARGVQGLIRTSDSDDVDLRSSSAAADERLNAARRDLTVVLSLFDADGRRVIGEYNNQFAKTVLPILCPHRDGLAFRVPASGRPGRGSPVQAARELDHDLSLAGFGSRQAAWTVTSRTATTATVTTATTTLHATARPDGTWVITSGQRCTT